MFAINVMVKILLLNRFYLKIALLYLVNFVGKASDVFSAKKKTQHILGKLILQQIAMRIAMNNAKHAKHLISLKV